MYFYFCKITITELTNLLMYFPLKFSGESNWDYERRMRTFRRRLREADWTWLTACMGVVEADMNPVEAYLNTGGDPTRKLTNPEVALLNRPSVYEAGHTLVHLAIK